MTDNIDRIDDTMNEGDLIDYWLNLKIEGYDSIWDFRRQHQSYVDDYDETDFEDGSEY